MKLNGKKKTWIWPVVFLCSIVTFQQVIPMILKGTFFGSNGDWISQHVAIAETLRDAMIQAKSLIPQFVQLGGGSSIYEFSYYGLLRPDVILACFFQTIPIHYFVAGYALCGVYASGILTYFWLRKKNMQDKMALFGALILISSTAFYHAHHQIMFINYMPFLLLALHGVDRILEKQKSSLLIVSCVLICIHSFYYAPACMVVISLYGTSQCVEVPSSMRKKIIEKIVFSVIIAVGVSMILLFPTALEIIGNTKDGGKFANENLPVFWLDAKGLLYSPYSCGLTVLTLFSLFYCIFRNCKRWLALGTLGCMTVPFISLILNGGLYAREKILIPFLPICALLTATMLEKLWHCKEKYDFITLILCFIPVLFSNWKIVGFLEIGILTIWLFLQRSSMNKFKNIKNYTFGICLIPVVLSLFFVNMFDENWYHIKQGVRQDLPQSFLEILKKEELYRTEMQEQAFMECNLADRWLQRSSMYSSITNAMYAKFFYDTMKNPIGYNNRVALVAGENPYFNYFMGIKYIIAGKEKTLNGYKKIMEEGEVALFENKQVLPICYGTSKIMSNEEYQQLTFPDRLEALCTSAVVDTNTSSVKFSGHAKEVDPKELQDFFYDQIRILQFQISREDKKQVVISIDNIKNKLSSKEAPYPNHNTEFTYILNASTYKKPFFVQASKGKYEITNAKAYILDPQYLRHQSIEIPKMELVDDFRNQVFLGKIHMQHAGYFITSYPWKKGYRVYVDGHIQKPEIVNTAFLGFPIEKGAHQIEIQFEAPGYKEGKRMTVIFIILWIGLIFIEKKEEMKNET